MTPIRPLVSSLVVALVLGSGCASTIQRKVETPQNAGFLADVYDKLEPGKSGQAGLRYVNPDANWRQYREILLEPVQYWADRKNEVSAEEAQMLTTYFHAVMKENLEKKGFPLAQLPGPGVLRIDLALLDATAATPVLRTVSLVVPMSLVLNAAQRLVTGRATFSGQIQVALRATDSQTGEVLAAALDRQAGGVGIQQAVQWKWGDAEAAMNAFADASTKRLRELTDRMKAN